MDARRSFAERIRRFPTACMAGNDLKCGFSIDRAALVVGFTTIRTIRSRRSEGGVHRPPHGQDGPRLRESMTFRTRW